MALATKDIDASSTLNPLDMVEEIITLNDWSCDRASDEEMVVEIKGRWTSYRLYFVWHATEAALLFSCVFDSVAYDKDRLQEMNNLLSYVNQRLWMGHFELTPEDNSPAFRHTVLMRGQTEASFEQMEDLMDVAMAECERFYPAFKLVTEGQQTALEAVSKSIFETVGQA
jgi:hypothetical protein